MWRANALSEAISESLNGPQSGEKTGFASGEAFAAEADGFCASFEFLPIIFLEATDQTKLRRQFCRAVRGPDRCCSDNFRARRNQEPPSELFHHLRRGVRRVADFCQIHHSHGQWIGSKTDVMVELPAVGAYAQAGGGKQDQ